MEAVVFDDFNQAEVRDVDRPEPGDDEVLLAVNRVQLSVTECHLYRGADIAHHDQILARFEDGPARLFGHEFCGEVVEAGRDVTKFDVGDRVYAPRKIPCFSCRYCLAGSYDWCKDQTQIGYDIPGGLAEYTVLPEYPLTKVTGAVSDAEGAAMQPFAAAVLGAAAGEIEIGDTVAVVGLGVMGYSVAQLAKILGADPVYGIDIIPEKLDLAENAGITAVHGEADNPVGEILDHDDSDGIDVVFEAVGGEQNHVTTGNDPIAMAFDLVRKGGRLVQISHIIGEVGFSARQVRSKRIEWMQPPPTLNVDNPTLHHGSLAVDLIANDRIDINSHITHELPGLDSFADMIDITLNKDKHGALGPAQIIV